MARLRLYLLKDKKEQFPTSQLFAKVSTVPGENFILVAGVLSIIVGLVLTFATRNFVAGILFALTLYEIIMSFADGSTRRKRDVFADQTEIFLVELGSVADKMPFLPGIKAVLENTPQPLQNIVKGFVRQYEMGVPITIASENKDLKMLVELLRLKEVYGGDISGSLKRLSEKAKATRDLRSEIKTSLKGAQVALVSQYAIMGTIMLLTLRQQMFQDIMIHTSGGKIIMAIVAAIFYGSAYYSRRAVRD